MDEFKIAKRKINIVDLLVESKLMSSRGEAKRKIREGAIDVDGVRVDDIAYNVELNQAVVLRAGKHKFLRVSKK
jgi:tyrosyl-tRNA synthetase